MVRNRSRPNGVERGMTGEHSLAEGPVPSRPVLSAVTPPEIDAVFTALFAEHRHRVFSTALRLTGRRPDAEDLTAETFLLAYRSLSGFDYERLDTLQPRAWLSAIVVNQWRNQFRNASRRPRVAPAPSADGPEPVDPGPAVEQRVEAHEAARQLAAALLVLPERQRIAVVLRFIGDLSMAEVGEAMGCPVGTAKSLVSRALDRLRPLVSAGGAGLAGPPANEPERSVRNRGSRSSAPRGPAPRSKASSGTASRGARP
jgi:RNA polymerase sigma factor (sigma-70 family)